MVDYLVEQGADLTALTDDGWSALAIARGLSYSDFYKAQVHTAARLEEIMQERGLVNDPMASVTATYDDSCAMNKTNGCPHGNIHNVHKQPVGERLHVGERRAAAGDAA